MESKFHGYIENPALTEIAKLSSSEERKQKLIEFVELATAELIRLKYVNLQPYTISTSNYLTIFDTVFRMTFTSVLFEFAASPSSTISGVTTRRATSMHMSEASQKLIKESNKGDFVASLHILTEREYRF